LKRKLSKLPLPCSLQIQHSSDASVELVLLLNMQRLVILT